MNLSIHGLLSVKVPRGGEETVVALAHHLRAGWRTCARDRRAFVPRTWLRYLVSVHTSTTASAGEKGTSVKSSSPWHIRRRGCLGCGQGNASFYALSMLVFGGTCTAAQQFMYPRVLSSGLTLSSKKRSSHVTTCHKSDHKRVSGS